jgi:phosphonate transport system substrate-binding protein
MPSRRRLLLAALGAFAGRAGAQDRPGGARPLTFAVISPRASDEITANWAPFVARLGEAVRQQVELRAFADASPLVASFRRGEIDLAWMGNVPALEVVESGAGSVFAQMVSSSGGYGYNAVLVVPAASTIASLQDVIAGGKALRFGDGDPGSTSGHLIPLYYAFQKNGINDVRTVFKSVSNASHQRNLTMVARGEADVATANTEELALFARDFPALAPRVRVVWQSPLIPQSPLLWRDGLAADLRRRIRQFVVGFGKGDAEQRRILQRVNGLSGFRTSSNRQLLTVADIEMFRMRQAIANDATLSAPERSRRIDAAIERASRLEILLKLSADAAR